MKNSNQKGFSLVIAMGLVILMTVMAMVVLEFAVPFSKDIKGIENASNAYYQANSGFEEAIYFISQKPVGSESGKTLPSTQTGYSFNIFATGTGSPLPLKGNSDFDKDWNKISEGNSIQMEIGSGRITNFNNVKAYFRVPDLTGTSGLPLLGTNNVITWKLTSLSDKLLNASGSEIKANEVCKTQDSSCTGTGLSSLWGEDLIGTGHTFKDFYDNECKNSGISCILKISVINDLKLSYNNAIVPYLEWRIDFGTNKVPTRYADINVSGKSYGFKKDLKFSVPQKTLLDTFDFTIFQ